MEKTGHFPISFAFFALLAKTSVLNDIGTYNQIKKMKGKQ